MSKTFNYTTASGRGVRNDSLTASNARNNYSISEDKVFFYSGIKDVQVTTDTDNINNLDELQKKVRESKKTKI